MAWHVGAGCLLLTGLAAAYITITAATRDQERFEHLVQRSQRTIVDHLDTYVALLRGASGLFTSAPRTTLHEFHVYVRQIELRTRYPGVPCIGFSKRVLPEEREALIAQLRMQGDRTFQIWPEHKQAEYHPVIYLEPRERRNAAAIGYDMFTEPVRRAAMERARDSGLPAASGRVTLVEEIGAQEQAGFLIYLPVYFHRLAPTTVSKRRAAFVGFVYMPLRADDLLEGIFGREEDPRLAIDIFDSAELSPEHRMDRSGRSIEEREGTYQPRFRTTRALDVAGRRWTISFADRPAFDLESERSLPLYILAFGGLLSVILAVLTRSRWLAQTAAERGAANLRESLAVGRQVLRSALDCIVVMDSAGRLTDFNPAAERTFGFSRAEVMGKDLSELIIPARLRERHRLGLARYLTTQEPGGVLGKLVETVACAKDGTEFPIELAVTCIEMDGPPLFTAHLRDITERRRAQKRLRDEAHTLATLNRIGRSLAAELDPQRLVHDITDASTQLTGAQLGTFFYDVSRPTGKSYTLNLLSNGRDEAFEEFSKWQNNLLFMPDFRSGKAVRIDDLVLSRLCGISEPLFALSPVSPRVRSYLAVPVILRSGELLGALAFGHLLPAQFSERHENIVTGIAAMAAIAMDNAQLYHAAQSARESAEAANRSKDEFLALLSHELRTPLNAVLGWTQLLRDGSHDEAEVSLGLERIERNATAQAQLIADLLDVSRIVSGKMRIEAAPVDLGLVIEATIEAVTPAAAAKQIEVQAAIEPLIVRGDATRLQQIFWNLLSNAVKFTPAGGRVEVRLEQVDAQAVITVRDNGPGITPEFLPHVFERFRQFDSSSTRKHGGLGLGLAIVRHLVELHGGTVEAASAGPEQGASFVVTLPLHNATAQPAALPPAHLAVAAGAHNNGAAPSLDGLRVLVVDDEADARDVIKAVLESCAARVTAVGSARAAIEEFARATPDILISDIGMPEQDGYDLIRHVRALRPERGGTVPALALTAFARSEDRDQALRAGFQMHATKPIGRDDLIAMVTRLSGR